MLLDVPRHIRKVGSFVLRFFTFHMMKQYPDLFLELCA